MYAFFVIKTTPISYFLLLFCFLAINFTNLFFLYLKTNVISGKPCKNLHNFPLVRLTPVNSLLFFESHLRLRLPSPELYTSLLKACPGHLKPGY